MKMISRSMTPCLIWLLSLMLFCTAQAAPLINRIVAIVNDDVITQYELDQALEFSRKEQNFPLAALSSTSFQRGVLAGLIIDKIVTQLATINHITVSDEELKAALSKIAFNAHIPLSQLNTAIEEQGLSFELYQQKMRARLLASKIEQDAVSPQIQINPVEVEEQIQQLKHSRDQNMKFEISHILVPVSADATLERRNEIKAEVEAIVAAHRTGTSFKDLAKQHSKASDADSGGYLGFKTLDEHPALFIESLKTLQPGEVSSPIETPEGFHLIKLDSIASTFLEPFFIEEVQLQQIVIHITPLVSETQAHTTLLNIIQDLLNQKESFEILAERFSQDEVSAAQGGNLGWIPITQLPSDIQAAIRGVEDNHLTDPLRFDNTWRVMKVLGHRQENQQELHQRNVASQVLFEKKAVEALQAWQAQIRNESYVKILDPNLEIDSLGAE